MGSSWCHMRMTADRKTYLSCFDCYHHDTNQSSLDTVVGCFRIPEECERSGWRCLCWSRLVGTEQSAGLPLRKCLTREEKLVIHARTDLPRARVKSLDRFNLSSAQICTDEMPRHSLILSQSSSHRFGRIIRFSLLIWVPAVCWLQFSTEFMQKKENTG